jgi:hypothetical protein
MALARFTERGRRLLGHEQGPPRVLPRRHPSSFSPTSRSWSSSTLRR